MIWSDVLVQWYNAQRIEAILEAPTNLIHLRLSQLYDMAGIIQD